MHHSKLIQLFKSLTNKDLAAFPKYAKNASTTLELEAIKLFHYIKRFAPEFISNRLRRALVCRHLLKDTIISKARLNKIANQLIVLLEDFLVFYDLEHQSNLKQQLLLQSLKRRNAPSFTKGSLQFIHQLNQEEQSSTEEQFQLFQLHNDLWSDINTRKISGKITHFQRANEYLDCFYFQQKLAFILEYNASKSIRQHEFELLFDESILEIIKAHPILNEKSTVKLQLAAIKMQKSLQKEDFIELKELFFDHCQQLSKPEAQFIFMLLNNFYNQQLNKDIAFYAHEGFLLYRFAVEKKLLLENGRIRDIEYANAAMVGFYAAQNEWAFDFIEQFKPLLSPAVQNATYAQVNAFYHFLQKDFEQAHQWIVNAELCHPLTIATAIKIDTLKLRTIFEQWRLTKFQDEGLSQVLTRDLKSFQGFIKKHPNLPKSKKSIYLTFSHLFQQLLLQARQSNSMLPIAQFETDLDLIKTIPYKNWFKEKIEQIKATYPTF